MKKIFRNILLSSLIVIAIIGEIYAANDWNFYIKQKNSDWQYNYNIIPQLNKDIYSSAFSLCWKNFKNTIGEEIEFTKKTPDYIKNLNNFQITESNINPELYYIKSGKNSLILIEEINDEIKKHFGQEANIKDFIESFNNTINNENRYFLYSALVKNFIFESGFDILSSESFNNSKEKYKYFGIDSNEIYKNKDYSQILKNIDFLFYNSENDFAVKILDKDKKEEIIFYLTNSKASFDTLYKEILVKQERFNFSYRTDRLEKLKSSYEQTLQNNVFVLPQIYLKIPFINIDKLISYKDIENKQIKGIDYENNQNNNFIITNALQYVKFDFYNNMSLQEQIQNKNGINFKIIIPNKYYFDRPFVIFVKKTNEYKPYLAAKINNGNYLIKE